MACAERVTGVFFDNVGLLMYFDAIFKACPFVIGFAFESAAVDNIVSAINNVFFICLFILILIILACYMIMIH